MGEEFLEFRLIMLFEDIDRAEIIAEQPQIPLVRVKVRQRNSGIVLHNSFAVFENEIADGGETFLEHQIR